MKSIINWTKIDEAPALASYSLLPILNSFLKGTGIDIELKDISLAGRIIANFPDNLSEEQKIHDYLSELGELTQHPEAIIIKLPNISASIPQINNAVAEARSEAEAEVQSLKAQAEDQRRQLRDKSGSKIASAAARVMEYLRG